MLTNATGAYGQSVSEHMFAMMWSIMKNLHIYAVGNPNAAWQDAGRVISPTAKPRSSSAPATSDRISHAYARASVCRPSASAATPPSKRRASTHGRIRIARDVLQYADVIAMCVPSTPSTHHLLNAERIAKLKTDAIVINAGRGDAIDTQRSPTRSPTA